MTKKNNRHLVKKAITFNKKGQSSVCTTTGISFSKKDAISLSRIFRLGWIDSGSACAVEFTIFGHNAGVIVADTIVGPKNDPFLFLLVRVKRKKSQEGVRILRVLHILHLSLALASANFFLAPKQ